MSYDIDTILHKFMHEFYGYGNYHGKIWFIGMEEGGGNTKEEIMARINAWTKYYRELEDVASYHQAIGIDKFFADTPVLQTTWSQLIRIVLCFQDIAPSADQIRQYQAKRLGRRNDDTCLLELLPLPSPSTSKWHYNSISTLPYLSSRKNYSEELLAFRIKSIQQKILQYSPDVVIFYSKKYAKYWEEIADVQFTETADNISTGNNGTTTFAIVTHPATRGVTNEYFCMAGNVIRSLHQARLPA